MLSVNMFLVDSLFPGSSIRGISRGLPGPPGLHGTSVSAVFVSRTGGNLGHVMAHEIGHFIGLFHTTELSGDVDPIEDTPSCERTTIRRSPRSCPDQGYVMFPLADLVQAQWSPGQEYVWKANPLVQYREPE